VKTHYPFSYFEKNEYASQGVIFIVRNPFDTFESLFSFAQTDSHSKKLSEEEWEKAKDAWKIFLECEIKWFKKYYQFWMENLNKVPLMIFRYEDFNLNKSESTKQLFQFLFKFQPDPAYLNSKTLEDILQEIDTTNKVNDLTYVPRMGDEYYTLKNRRYTPEELEKIFSELWNVLEFFWL